MANCRIYAADGSMDTTNSIRTTITSANEVTTVQSHDIEENSKTMHHTVATFSPLSTAKETLAANVACAPTQSPADEEIKNVYSTPTRGIRKAPSLRRGGAAYSQLLQSAVMASIEINGTPDGRNYYHDLDSGNKSHWANATTSTNIGITDVDSSTRVTKIPSHSSSCSSGTTNHDLATPWCTSSPPSSSATTAEPSSTQKNGKRRLQATHDHNHVRIPRRVNSHDRWLFAATTYTPDSIDMRIQPTSRCRDRQGVHHLPERSKSDIGNLMDLS